MNRSESSPRGRRLMCAALVVGLAAFAALVLRSPVPMILAPIACAYGVHRRMRSRARAAAAVRSAAVIGFCSTLRAELEAGRHPAGALDEAVRSHAGLVDPPGRATTLAADPVAGLRAAAAIPGSEGLVAVAAAWQAAHDHGVPLAAALAGIEEGLRAEDHNRQALEAELSGIRATTVLLALLPLLGLALGSALGARPIHAALTKPVAQLGLTIGLLLELAGMFWTDRLVVAAQHPGGHPVGHAPGFRLGGFS